MLLDVLRKASPDTNTTPIKQAFVLLATFQEIRNSASGSVDDWLDPMTETFNSQDNASPQESGRDTISRKSYFDSVQEQMELEGAASKYILLMTASSKLLTGIYLGSLHFY